MESSVRLNKFIASNGLLSRRKIDELIEQGRVTVNKKTVTELGYKINPEADKVFVDGEHIKPDTKKIYIMLYKPHGVITSVSDEKKRTTVIDLIKINQKIFPVGRLDYSTSGLLLLTNDGGLANKLMNPKSRVYKTYYAELSRPLEEKHRLKLSGGIKIEGVMTAPSIIKFPKTNDYLRLTISIHEGRNRQIHNMFEHFGYFVRVLRRIEYAGLNLGGLKEGEWRYLTSEEISSLIKIVKDTPGNYIKSAGSRKRSFRKADDKFKVRERKNRFKKTESSVEKNDKKQGFNKKLREDRGIELGFKKINAMKDSNGNNKTGTKVNFSSGKERKDLKKEYKKSDRFRNGNKKTDIKRNHKKSSKSNYKER